MLLALHCLLPYEQVSRARPDVVHQLRPAVNIKHGARDEGGRIGRKPQDGGRLLLRLAHTLQQMHLYSMA